MQEFKIGLICISTLWLVGACSQPQDSAIAIVADLTTIDLYSGDTLLIESLSIPSGKTVDFSRVESFDYDFSIVSDFRFERPPENDQQFKAVFVTQIRADQDYYSTSNLYAYAGNANALGEGFGQVRFYFYTVNSQMTGSFDVIMRYGVYDGDTLGIDTISVDLERNNIFVPFDFPNVVPTIIEASNNQPYGYYLEIDENMTHIDDKSGYIRLNSPILFCQRMTDKYAFGGIIYPTVSIKNHFTWDSNHVYPDSISIFPIEGL